MPILRMKKNLFDWGNMVFILFGLICVLSARGNSCYMLLTWNWVLQWKAVLEILWLGEMQFIQNELSQKFPFSLVCYKQETGHPIYVSFPPASAVDGMESVLSVCLCVFQRSHGWTVTDLKFGRNIAFDNISNKLEGQGHRSKVKVAILKNVIFRVFSMVWPM